MKPNGLVFAASITSQTSIFIRCDINAISLTRPMFTARNVFSSSLTISATCVELTGTTVSTAAEYSAVATSEQAGVVPPTTLGVLRVLNFSLAGIDALGRERQVEPVADLRGRAPRTSAAAPPPSSPGRSSTRARSACPDGCTWRSLPRPLRRRTCRGPSSCAAASARRCRPRPSRRASTCQSSRAGGPLSTHAATSSVLTSRM